MLFANKRVIPRDFFNEAKLLKCLGHLELFINHSGKNKIGLHSVYDGLPFKIIQNPNDGSLSVENYIVLLKGKHIYLSIPYNAKENYPLIGLYDEGEYYVFDEEGKFMTNFGVGEDE